MGNKSIRIVIKKEGEREMNFTYNSYVTMLSALGKNGYVFTNYHTCDIYKRCVILRHDIDTSLEKAVELAKLEAQQGVRSTYFVLLSSGFYNVMSKGTREKIKEIQNMGHDIGLHFDELNYDKNLWGGGYRNLLLTKSVF